MDSGQVLVIAAAGLLAVAAIAQTTTVGIVQAGDAVAFGSLVALGELLRITLPGNRESAPIASAGALGYALLLGIGERAAVQSALQVIVITAGAMIVGASALLIAFATEVMGLAAVWVFTGPLLVSQVAFRRYAGIRTTYLETVRALSRMTEVGGYVEGGHSRRVSRLAVAVGRELGMNEPELLELEYAALMHDIGQLS